ncbi:MAG: helix-turn-helix domain-containing protein [Anaerovorax sp.]|nr:helix-turn-helix domain-containing protein [Anaerovorax sp.]
MHAWEQIQKTIDYIEKHLSEEIDIDTLSKIAALSPFYYQRLFSRLVKKPVMEYIKLRRMARATEDLLHKDKRILDVALDLGFSSHEQFTRTFKDTFGTTPESYRKAPITLNRMTKPQLLLNYTLIDENVPLISDGIVLEITRKQITVPEQFIGLETKAPVQFIAGLGIESGVDPLVEVWDNFHSQKADISNLINGGVEIGVSHPCAEEGYFSYFAGAQANSASISKDLHSWELPAGEYIICSFEAENFESLIMDVLYKVQRYLFETWLPSHNLTTEAFCIERYESHDKETSKMEIWVKPVALLK